MTSRLWPSRLQWGRRATDWQSVQPQGWHIGLLAVQRQPAHEKRNVDINQESPSWNIQHPSEVLFFKLHNNACKHKSLSSGRCTERTTVKGFWSKRWQRYTLVEAAYCPWCRGLNTLRTTCSSVCCQPLVLAGCLCGTLREQVLLACSLLRPGSLLRSWSRSCQTGCSHYRKSLHRRTFLLVPSFNQRGDG